VYNYSHWKGRGPTRMSKDYKLVWKYGTNMNECTQEIGYLQSINSDKYLPQSPFTGQFFYVDILHCLLWVLSFYDYMVNRNAKTDFNKNNNGVFSIQLLAVFGLDRRVD
jgi:hypothetical protein